MNLFQISGFLAVILFSFSDLTGSQLNFNRREKVRKSSSSLGSAREEDASSFGGTFGPRSGLCAGQGDSKPSGQEGLQAGLGRSCWPQHRQLFTSLALQPQRFWNHQNEKQIFLNLVCSRNQICVR